MMRVRTSTFFAMSIAAVFAASSMAMDLSLRVTLGDDRGQPLGSLFEARDEEGHVVAGAGFNDAHATYLRDHNRQIVFYVKTASPQPTITNLGKPFGPENNGTRLQVVDDKLVAFHRAGNAVAFQTLDGDGAWTPYDAAWTGTANAFGGTQLVGNKHLVFEGSRIRYDGAVVYSSELGSGRYYYSGGKLFLYHGDPDRLYVVAWAPGDIVSLEAAKVFDIVGNVFTYGTYNDEVLITTNVGEFYSYEDGTLTTHRTTDGKSWQGYSMLQFYDKVLIGHYPSGSLYAYDDDGLRPFTPPLPVPEEVSANAREAQTLAIYGGYLYVGVWPWGEVWRFDHETDAWRFAGRVFDRPVMTQDDQEPFARAMKDKPAPYNYWGQRVTSLTNFGDSLYIATMNKQGKPLLPEHEFLDKETVAQYGAIHQLHIPGQIAATFEWKAESTFRFVVEDGTIAIFQDGTLLGRASSGDTSHLNRMTTTEIGTGIFGALRGKAETIQ